MSTWAELRQEILIMLDLNSSLTSGDLHDLIDIKVKRVRDKYYALRPPRSLLVSSSTVTATSDLVAIKTTGSAVGTTYPSFALSNLRKHWTVTVEDEDWDFIPWESWIRAKNARSGNQRPHRSWTIDYQDYIYLADIPTGTETWDVVLHYLKTPTAIADDGEIEIGSEHEELLATAVAVQFPNQFIGEERLLIYQGLISRLKQLESDFLRDYPIGKKGFQFRPRTIRKSESSVLWGTGETS